MRTSMVVKLWGGEDRFERAGRPEDGIEVTRGVRFIPAHKARGIRSNPKTGRTEKEWMEPDVVHARSCSFEPDKKGVIDRIRKIDGVAIEALERYDQEREALRVKIREIDLLERGLLKQAFESGNPITVDEVKSWKGKYRNPDEVR